MDSPLPHNEVSARQQVDRAKHALLAEFTPKKSGADDDGPVAAAMDFAQKHPIAVGAVGLISFILFRKSAVAKAALTAAATRLAVAGVKRLK